MPGPNRAAALARIAALAAAAAAEPVRAQTLPKLRCTAIPIEISAAPYYAREQGFFAEHGLDVEVLPMANGPAAAAAVLGASAEIGAGNTASLATAHERGLPIVLIAPSGAYSARTPDGGLVVLQSSPIHRAQDLIGKTVAIAALRGVGEVGMRAWCDKNGVSGDSLRFIELPYSAMGAALTSGRADAVVPSEPAFSRILSSGARVVAPVFDAIGPLWIEGGFFCTRDYLRAHADTVKRFADAIAQTDAWANKNPALTARILETALKLPVSANQTRTYYPERLDPAQLQPLIDAAAKYGFLKAAFPATELIAPGVTTA